MNNGFGNVNTITITNDVLAILAEQHKGKPEDNLFFYLMIVLEDIYDKGYSKGVEDGNLELDRVRVEGYEQGVQDGWNVCTNTRSTRENEND
jgi:hypothetical protein